MSYTNEKDPLSELTVPKTGRRSGGYSEEIERPAVAGSGKPSAAGDPVPGGAAKPAVDTAFPPAQPTVPDRIQPVKLRPPAHVKPHPLDLSASPPEPTMAAAPALEDTAGHVVKDEELLIYDDSEVPDFSDFDFQPVESVASSDAPPVPAAPAHTGAPQPRAAPPAERVPREAAPPLRPKSEAPPALPGPPSMPAKGRGLSFESDRSLAHRDATGSLLETRGLVKIYDGRTVVNGVDIHVRPGEIVGLLGPNGAGKTTSFYMIVGLVPPNGGQVIFNGNDVTTMPMYQRARLGMGYLPQEESIFRKLTVEENLLAVLETLPLSRQERLARCQELLERFSITHIRRNVALTCSGGEKRRLTIARSLVTMPSLLMLDEPFSGVDPIAVNEIQNIVESLRKSGLAILITDHNARQTLELVDRAYLIYEGRVLREGTREFLINDPVSRELYLGDRFTM